MKLPWHDRAGRFSQLKAAVFALCLVPGIWVAITWATVGLGARPVTEAIHQTGDWAVRFLLISLAVTPARRVFEWNRLILVRRILGIAALGYAATHFSLYILDMNFELGRVASEIALRFYLTIGFVALLGLTVLGTTSTDAMIRRLGATWNKVHKAVYVIGVLALFHYFLQSKINVTQPVMMTGYFLWLMGFRLVLRYRRPIGPLMLTGLAVAAGLGTALVEVAWYGLATGVPAGRVLAANLTTAMGIRPSLWVLGAGLAVAILQVLFGLVRSPAGTPLRARR